MGLRSWFSASTHPNADRGEYALVENVASRTSVVDAEAFASGSLVVDSIELSEEDKRNLRKVADTLPWSAFLVAIVELCERFTYYGLSGPFQNYIANKYHDPNGLPGAIGLDQQGATALTNFFVFWCYLTPILGAIIADQFLGKYWTIYYFAIVYGVGILVLFLTSIPLAIENGLALPGLIVAMIVIGLGTGGIKSNVSPLIAEQYSSTKAFIRTLKSGERVIVDPTVTIQRIYMVFYVCINIGALSPLATTVMELHTGFWTAFLLCLVMFLVGFVTFISGRKRYVIRPPTGSVIPNAFRVCWIGLTNRSLDAAKPEHLVRSNIKRVPWDSQFVEEVRRAITACKVFLFFPIYWCAFGQMLNNFVSQAGQMQLHGMPNDIMQNIDPITLIIFIPLCDFFLYPALRKAHINFTPMNRISVGFLFGSAAMLYAAFIQHLIYTSAPCYDKPRACSAGRKPDGSYLPNNVHVALQSPAYLLTALGEIFAAITGLEFAYSQAPPTMKSFIMSLFLLTNAGGAVLGGLVSPFSVDPKLVSLYLGLAVACAISGGVFWLLFRNLNHGGVVSGAPSGRQGEDDGYDSIIADDAPTIMAKDSLEEGRK